MEFINNLKLDNHENLDFKHKQSLLHIDEGGTNNLPTAILGGEKANEVICILGESNNKLENANLIVKAPKFLKLGEKTRDLIYNNFDRLPIEIKGLLNEWRNLINERE